MRRPFFLQYQECAWSVLSGMCCALHRALCNSSTSLRLISDWLAPMKLEQLRQYDSMTLLLCGDWMCQNRGCPCCAIL